jgi:hypothetical protein
MKPPELRKASCCFTCRFRAMGFHSAAIKCLKFGATTDMLEVCAMWETEDEPEEL